MIVRFLLLFWVVGIIGCSELHGLQEPAPVFGEGADSISSEPTIRPSPPVTTQLPETPEVIETKPLEGMNKQPEMVEIKPDLPPQTPPQSDIGMIPPGTPQPGTGQEPGVSFGQGDPFATEQPDGTLPPEVQPPAGATNDPTATPEPTPPPDPEPKAEAPFTPLETFPDQSPAVGSLVIAANENSQGGNLDSAVSSIERAIRIEPRNPTLYYKLALLRLQQSKPRLAEDLARKAALLSADDNNLKKHSWLLVANAREQQSNMEGAEKAKAEAAKYQ